MGGGYTGGGMDQPHVPEKVKSEARNIGEASRRDQFETILNNQILNKNI